MTLMGLGTPFLIRPAALFGPASASPRPDPPHSGLGLVQGLGARRKGIGRAAGDLVATRACAARPASGLLPSVIQTTATIGSVMRWLLNPAGVRNLAGRTKQWFGRLGLGWAVIHVSLLVRDPGLRGLCFVDLIRMQARGIPLSQGRSGKAEGQGHQKAPLTDAFGPTGTCQSHFSRVRRDRRRGP